MDSINIHEYIIQQAPSERDISKKEQSRFIGIALKSLK